MSRDFTKIRAWQLSDDFTVEVYKITKDSPREEVYGLSSQLRRAASSVPANIAAKRNICSFFRLLQVHSPKRAISSISQDGSLIWARLTIQERASWPKKRAKP